MFKFLAAFIDKKQFYQKKSSPKVNMLVRRKRAKLSINKSRNDKIRGGCKLRWKLPAKKITASKGTGAVKKEETYGCQRRKRGGEIRERMTGGGEGGEAYIR